MNAVGEKLQALGYEPAPWMLSVTEKRIAAFESRFELRLPKEYRSFLLQFGGWTGSALCSFQEPTPCGKATWIDLFYGFGSKEYKVYDIRWATEAFGEAPNFVAIAAGAVDGCMVVLKCRGRDLGHIYLHDAAQRALWTDQQFREFFPNLSPIVQQYLTLRRQNKLPSKPKGYESLFRLGTNFVEFIEALRQPDE